MVLYEKVLDYIEIRQNKRKNRRVKIKEKLFVDFTSTLISIRNSKTQMKEQKNYYSNVTRDYFNIFIF